MGAYCCKWVCRPCRRNLTVYDRIELLYKHSGENYSKAQAKKLNSYLKDRQSAIKPCIDEIKKHYRQAFKENMGRTDMDTVLTTLVAVSNLLERSSEFAVISYEVSYWVLLRDDLEELRPTTIEVLNKATLSYPDSASSLLEEIFKHLTYSVGREFQKDEVLLLSNLSFALKHQILKSSIEWKNAVSIALSRAFLKHFDEVQEEVCVLKTFSKLMASTSRSASDFINHVVHFIHENNLWNQATPKVFQVVSSTKEAKKALFFNELVKRIVNYLSKEARQTEVQYIVKCVIEVVKESSSDSIDSCFYKDHFKEVLLLTLSWESKPLCRELLSEWSCKASFQSTHSLFKRLVFSENFTKEHKKCLNLVRESLASKLESSNSSFHYSLLETCHEILRNLNQDNFNQLLKALAFLLSQIKSSFSCKKNLLVNLNVQLLKCMGRQLKCFDQKSLKLYKRCLQVWLVVLVKGNKRITNRITSVAAKLKEFIEASECKLHKYCMGVTCVILLKGVGFLYKLSTLECLVETIAAEHLSNCKYKEVLTRKNFMNLLSGKLKIFKKEELDLLHEVANPIESRFISFEDNVEVSLTEEIETDNPNDFEENLSPLDFVEELEVPSRNSLDSSEKVVELSEASSGEEKNYSEMIVKLEEQESLMLDELIN